MGEAIVPAESDVRYVCSLNIEIRLEKCWDSLVVPWRAPRRHGGPLQCCAPFVQVQVGALNRLVRSIISNYSPQY